MVYIIILFSLITACHKEPPIPIVPTPLCLLGSCDTSKLEIVWQKPISRDTSEKTSSRPIYFDGNVLFTRSTLEEGIDTLKMLNSKTGALVWQWSDYMIGRKPSLAFPGKIQFLKNSRFLFTTGNDVYCVNAQDGHTVWSSKQDSGYGSPDIVGIDNYIYQTFIHKIGSSTDYSYLLRANINDGKWDTIYTQPKIDGFEPDIEPPNISWKNTKGDQIVFFQIRYWDFPSSKGRIDWLALNLNTRKEEFRHNNIDRGQIGHKRGAFLLGDNVYFNCINSSFCINKNDGKILWQKNFDKDGETFTSTSPFVSDGLLFIKPDNRTLYTLNPNTGSEIRVDYDNGSGAIDMVNYNGILYYTCVGVGKIYAIEIATGKKIWAEPSPNKFKNILNGNRKYENAEFGYGSVTIDPQAEYLYTSDHYFAICLKLPKK